MIMPGRNFNSSEYRFGFQGQEKDDELKGVGNSISFKYRIHDPRLGRFLSIDPLYKEYSFQSPYVFSQNRVIDCIELEGLEAWPVKREWTRKDETKFEVFVAERIVEMQENNVINDCADLPVQLLTEYASKEGLDVSFTRTDGTKILASDKAYKDIGSNKFMQLVKGQTNAESIDNDMKPLDSGESPKPGDMTNDGYHVNVVRELEPNETKSDNVVPTASGTRPPREPKNFCVSEESEFKEFKVIDNANKRDQEESIRQLNEAGGVLNE